MKKRFVNIFCWIITVIVWVGAAVIIKSCELLGLMKDEEGYVENLRG